MFITGLGTAVPRRKYSQIECWEALRTTPEFAALSAHSQALLRKLLTNGSAITTRHLALEHLSDAFQLRPDALHHRFRQHGPDLATRAAENALAKAGLAAREIDALLISTCTGYLCPGLTSYVSEQLDLRADALALDLVGQGCGAALPNLRTAEALLASGRCQHALSICVEICSAAFFLDDDPGVLVSSCLFGDGAAAAVVSREPRAGRCVHWKTGATCLRPEERELLRFEQVGGMLRNILRPEVPAVAAREARQLAESTLAAQGIARKEIAAWVFHPGGREVLTALAREMELSDHDLRWSAAVLKEYGNLSSPAVLFVLDAALNDSVPPGKWWMSSFGAGFTCHGALLEIS